MYIGYSASNECGGVDELSLKCVFITLSLLSLLSLYFEVVCMLGYLDLAERIIMSIPYMSVRLLLCNQVKSLLTFLPISKISRERRLPTA